MELLAKTASNCTCPFTRTYLNLDLPSGPSIVMAATGLFGLARLFSPGNGAAWRRTGLASEGETAG